MARQALTVDHLSNGRLELGLGAGAPGEIDPSYAMTGIEDWVSGERVARFREVVEIVDMLLRNKVTTYEGRYYQLKDTVMQPDPVQKPRPPITIGALGSSMLRITARYADTWNSFGGSGLSSEEMLKETGKRNTFLDKYCKKIGRDPKTLRRSFLVFGPDAEALYDSVDAFKEVVKRYNEAGINEFILYYPWKETQLPVFECIAREVIPKLRSNTSN